MNITIFKDIKDTSQPFYRPVDVILQRIKDGASKELVKKIRNTKDKEQRNKLKQNLISFFGVFMPQCLATAPYVDVVWTTE